jgi:hypothetical protein
MKAAFRTLLGLAIVFAVTLAVRADDEKKEKVKTFKGTLGCAKCVFKVKGVTECTNAIQVTENKKTRIYIIDDEGASEPYHKKICTKKATGSVKGTLTGTGKDAKIKPEKDGVKID